MIELWTREQTVNDRDHLEAVCVELIDAELEAVSGGDIGNVITKAVGEAISAGAPQKEVWVGCAWVPQWW